MSWLVDNTNTICILLGLIAAALVVAWRFNQRVKFLGYAAGVLVLLALFWVATRFIDTDGKQLERNVDAMAQAVMDGKVDDLFKHISNDFVYEQMTRDLLYAAARKSIEGHKVTSVRITGFKVGEVSRANKTAKTRFTVKAWTTDMDQPFIFDTEAEFVLEGTEWKLKTMDFFDFVRKNQKIRLPGI